MPLISLRDYQEKAVDEMHNGCILCGGVGSGKSRTALAYYFRMNGGEWRNGCYESMQDPLDLVIITTARKRDTHEWEEEMLYFLIYSGSEKMYNHEVYIDSWNNIKKYEDMQNAFFIFDEQRVVGRGTWVKAFLKIAKRNQWILLSATPGDNWSDYAPVFIANGYFRNFTDFNDRHVIWKRTSTFSMISGYRNTGALLAMRNRLLVDMDFIRETRHHEEHITCHYNRIAYMAAMKSRWDYAKNKPFESASEMCYALRKIVNKDEERQTKLLDILDSHPKAIVFYSFDYELDILLNLGYKPGTSIAQWNGHRHEEIPASDSWVYLVQYTAGAEGWNCTVTDTMIFFSQQYSYKILAQAMGRIDRMNTPFKDLFYYHLVSKSPIDLAISKALANKKTFNEKGFTKW